MFRPTARFRKAPNIFAIDREGIGEKLRRDASIQGLEGIAGDMARPSDHESRFLGSTVSSRRLRFGTAATVALVFLLAGRSAQLQIMEGEHFRGLAEGNRIRSVVLAPRRGEILDRHGNPLAQNIPSFVLGMRVSQIPQDQEERDAVLNRVSELTGLHRAELDFLMTEFASSGDTPVPVLKGMTYEAAMRLAIETAALPGFSLETSSIRSYALAAPSLSHVLGYVGKMSQEEYQHFRDFGYRRPDEIGKSGIEWGMEEALRGIPGNVTYEVDALGNSLAIVSKSPPSPGADLILTLDAGLQKYAEDRLNETFVATGTSRGSVVVVDVQSGAVRALVSLPAYDNNAFARGISREEFQGLLDDADKPLFSRAVSGSFPSGSTFKPFIAYAALDAGVISERTSILSTGGIAIGQWFFPDWRYGGHGQSDVRKAIAESVNTFFYTIGGGYQEITGLGVERITDYARMFGFGERTGIRLPSESAGFLPSKEWKEEAKGERWYVGDTYNLSIGQGDLLVTPLQMALATATVANGGNRVFPRLVEAVDGGDGSVLEQEDPSSQEFDAYALHVVREGMRQTVTQGSARSLSLLPITSAGKTGTAQNIGGRPTHAWYVGFAPYENPEIAVVVLVEEGGEGSSVAVPIARDILTWWHYQGE